MARRRRQQVGLEADVEEDRIGGELGRELPGARPSSAWMRASTAPTARAVAASAWPSRSACFHSRSATARGSSSPARRGADAGRAPAAVQPGAASLRHLHPARLVAGCARSARASRRRRAASTRRAWRRPGRARCRSARCRRTRRRSAAGRAASRRRPARARAGLRELLGDRDRVRPRLSHGAADSTSLTSACSAWLAGVGDAELAAAPGDEAVEMVDLARLAARHVLGGRRQLCRHRRGDAFHRLERARQRQVDAVGRGHRHHLGDDRAAAARGSTASPPSGRTASARARRWRCRRSSPSASTTARPSRRPRCAPAPCAVANRSTRPCEARGHGRHPRRRRRASRRSRGRRGRSA